MSFKASKFLGEIEYMRVSRELQLLRYDSDFDDSEKASIEKYLKRQQKVAERMMNADPPDLKKPHFSS